MSRKFLPLLLIALLLLGVVFWGFRAPTTGENDQSEESGRHAFRTLLFNTDCQVVLYGPTAQVEEAYRELSEALNRFHNALNYYDPKSELARFNDSPAGKPFPCSPELWRAFVTARQAFEESDGAFDVTIGPLMNFWKTVAKSPDLPQQSLQEELAIIQENVGFRHLALDEVGHAITKDTDGVRVDFGGLAKGLALDLALEILEKHEIRECYLNFGGNTYQKLPQNAPYRNQCALADARHPEGGTPRVTLTGTDGKFLGTSALTYRPISQDESRPIGHIMDPETGNPVQPQYVSLTVVADAGWRSDAFSTAAFAKGEPMAQKLHRDNPALSFVFLFPEEDSKPIIIGNVTEL